MQNFFQGNSSIDYGFLYGNSEIKIQIFMNFKEIFSSTPITLAK